MSRPSSAVRNTCAQARSNRLRTAEEAQLLAEHGDLARVFELHGELYFATAERVFRHVIASLDAVDMLVLDRARVTRADDAATRMLDELRAAVDAVGCTLVLAGAYGQPDIDTALEWCEDRSSGASGSLQSPRPLNSGARSCSVA